ncbi:MAG: flagellar basal body P-ring protein FlgI [Planctomycetota bacterium]
MTRRAPLLILFSIAPLLAVGCTRSWLRPDLDTSALEEATREDSNLISRYTHPYGLNYVQVQSVALVTGLDGTGGDPPPTPQRAALLDEMKRHDVHHPNELLAKDSTALAVVTGYLRPGAQRGDNFDVEVRVPSRSDATSLRDGWLMPARLSEHAVLGQQVRTGHVLAEAEGAVLVDPSADEDEALATRGRVLSGGLVRKDRPLGLIISGQSKSVRLAKEIAAAVNERFSTKVDGRRTGVATPKTDEFVELRIDPRYKDNISRFTKVVRNIAIRESAGERQARLGRLALQLMDPLTAATAAVRLEAIGGEQAVEALKRGAKQSDAEVRFYAAEALAYLDETAAVEPLTEAARDEPAFRVNALAALSAMNDYVAYEALRSLLDVRSAETRYGAFRALWSMTPDDALVAGERLGGKFSYHLLDLGSTPMIHVTQSFRPEIVVFGGDQRFQLPMVLDAGKNILVNGMTGSQITVSRFSAGQPTQKRVVSTSVDAVIRAIVELGGTYPDVVQALQQAKQDGALLTSLRVDALPEAGRTYASRSADAREDAPLDPEDAGATPYRVATPLPDLFSRKGG